MGAKEIKKWTKKEKLPQEDYEPACSSSKRHLKSWFEASFDIFFPPMRRGTSYVSIVATALLWQMVSDSPWPWWEQDRLWPSGRQPQTLSKGEEEILVWFTAVGTGLIHSHTWRAH